MPAKLFRRLAAAVVGSLLVIPAALAQQQGGTDTGGTQTQTGGTGTTTSGGGGPLTSGGGSGNAPGSTSAPVGMSLPGLDFTQGTTATGGTAGGANSGSRSTRRTTGRTATTSLGGMTGGFQGGNFGGGRAATTGLQNNRQNERRAQYVTRMEFAPAPSEPGATAQVRSSVEASLVAIVPTGVSVSMDGSTAVLSGTVPSDHDRKLAERMALLEPGVRSVRNELAVKASTSANQ